MVLGQRNLAKRVDRCHTGCQLLGGAAVKQALFGQVKLSLARLRFKFEAIRDRSASIQKLCSTARLILPMFLAQERQSRLAVQSGNHSGVWKTCLR